MPDQTQRLTVSVQGTAEYQKLAAVADQARKALAALEAQQRAMTAAQGQIRGGTITPAIMRTAVGGSNADPTRLDEQMAASLARASAQVTNAKKGVSAADKDLNTYLRQQNALLAQNVALQKQAADTTTRVEATQARANLTLSRARDLNAQLNSVLSNPAATGAGAAGGGGLLSRLGAGAAGATGRLGGTVVTSLGYSAGAATGIPGAGVAGSSAASGLGSLIGSLPGVAKLAAGLVAGLVAAGVAVDNANATVRGMQQQLGGATALTGGGPRALTRGVLQTGSDFAVPMDQNQQIAQQLGQAGIAGHQMSRTLGLSYAVGTRTGMDLSQSAGLVSQYMVRQSATVEQAARAMQGYANAAGAAHISAQRLFTLMQQAQSSGAVRGVNAGQMAGLQAQLGQVANPAQMLAAPMSAIGTQSLVMENLLGVSRDQFRQLQRNPAQLMDRMVQTAQRLGGGRADVTAQILQSTMGLDLSGLPPDVVDKLVTAKPGQFAAYYNQYVRAGANAPTLGADAFARQQAAVRAGTLSLQDRAKTEAQYEILKRLNTVSTPPVVLPPGLRPGAAPTPLPRPSTTPSPAAGPTPGPGGVPSGAQQYMGAYQAASKATGVPIDVLIAQDMVESSFNPTAQNAGHFGMGQLSSALLSQYGVKNWRDPKQNIMGQAKYDQYLYKNIGSWEGTMAGYNEGLGGYRTYGTAGTEPGYMDKLAYALQALVASGFKVDVTVHDSSGRVMPSTATIRHGPTTSATPGPGQGRRS